MSEANSVLVVSAYGRGHWLAAELQAAGTQVHYVDVTTHLGPWATEDWEGPFGVFMTPETPQSQKSRLDSESPLILNPRGLTLWTEEGPFETRGDIGGYHLSRHQELADLLQLRNTDPKEFAKQKGSQASKAFQDNWYLQFCHSFSSNAFYENTFATQANFCPPVLGEHFRRQLHRRNYEQGLEWLENKGVKVYRKAKVIDIQWNSRFIQNIEIESEWSGVLNAEQVVWSLTSLETEFLSKPVYNILYDAKLEPQWVWQRYRCRLETEALVHLPEHFAFINELSLPWAHDNFMILQQIMDESESYDVWMRLPYSERLHRQYLKNKIDLGLSHLQNRCPSLVSEIINMPQENIYDEKQLGPSCLPVYDPDFLSQYATKSWINLSYHSPEQWPSLEWSGRFQYEEGVCNELLEWKKSKDQRQAQLRDQIAEHLDEREL